MTPMPEPIVYRRDARDVVTVASLGDIVALYHHRSGQTHMVISPVPEILERIAFDEPVSARDLLDRLARDFDLPDATEADIAAHLDALVALGLVRRA